MRSTLGRWLVCGAVVGAGLTGPAVAQTLKEAPAVLKKQHAAAQHFQLGVEFYRAGDYAAARVEFEAALGLSQQPDLLHNLVAESRLPRFDWQLIVVVVIIIITTHSFHFFILGFAYFFIAQVI